MATIESSIKLRDGMTPVLNKINNALDRTTNAQNRFNTSLNRGSSAASILVSKLKGVFSAYMLYQGAKGVIGIADELTMTSARLNLMTGDLQKTKELQDQIYESAMRSRSGYLQTADAVAKLRLRAGQIFTTNDEAIAFSETLNKMFAIAGASQSEMYSATLQLTQALGSGVLRGEEFRAVFEAAPNVMQAVADYMNLPIGKLREIANEGAISADIVKNAMFKASKQVDEQFKTIPKTWTQVWTLIKNYTIKATQPILERIRKITSSKRFISFMNSVGDAITFLSNVLGGVLDLMLKTGAVIYDNWSLIEPVIWGVVGAMMVHNAVLLAGLIKSAVAWLVSTYNAIAYQWALFKMTVAQYGFNTAISMCPLTWFVYLLIGIVVVFYLIIAAVNKFTGVSVSATGLIAGAFAWLGALIANIFIGIFNIGSGVVQAIVNAWNWCCENIGTVFHNIGVWWDNLWIDARVGFYSFINDVLSKLSSLAQKIQPLAELLDVDLSGMIGKAQASINTKISNLESGRRKAKAYTAYQEIDWKTKDYKDLGDAWDKGYDWGAGLETKLKNFGSNLYRSEDLKNSMSGVDGFNGLNDLGKALSGGFDTANPLLDKIGDNTNSMASYLSASDEDLSYMRDLAEREAINRYTLTDLKVEQNNNNNFANGVNAQEMLNLLKKILHEGVQSTANGVHF